MGKLFKVFKSRILWTVIVITGSVGAGGYYYVMKHHPMGDTAHSKKDSHAAKSTPAHPHYDISDPVGSAKLWVHNVNSTVEELASAHDENDRLRIENSNLRRWAESLRFDCGGENARLRTQDLELRLSKETGARFGRILAGIQYRPPTHLLPGHLYTLAVSYLKAKEYEKAAVILTFLVGMEKDDTFKTPANSMMTGIAWYYLDHFKEADYYFDQILELPEDDKDNLRYLAHGRLWKALVAHKMNQKSQSQSWLRQLVDHHPHSSEANWINSETGLRSPASSEPGEDLDIDYDTMESTPEPEVTPEAESHGGGHDAHSSKNEHH